MNGRWKNAAGAVLAVLASAAWGCNKDNAKKDEAGDHGHGHGHAATMAEAGKYHARLGIHLDEGEVEISFETQDQKPMPAALPLEGFAAQARIDGGEFREIKFEPAPAEERKSDKAGTCSRFAAKLPGLKEAKKIYVAAKVPIDGKEEKLEFRDIDPKTAGHSH